MKRRRPVHMLALVLGVVAAVPSIAAADTSFPAAAGDMTARGNLLVWTPWTGPGRLMSGFGDAAAPLPIPRARFGSVDLGTDARGRTVLVYRSCQAARPRHCAVYLYDFASQHHRRLAALDRSGCRVGDVRISRGTVAFARDCGGHALDGLYLKRRGSPSAGFGARRPRFCSRWGCRDSARSISRAERWRSSTSREQRARGGHMARDHRAPGAPARAAAQPAPSARAPARGPRRLRSHSRGRAPRLRVRVLGAAGVHRGLPAGDPPAPDQRERARDAARAGRPALHRRPCRRARELRRQRRPPVLLPARRRVPRRSSPRWRVRPSSAEPAPRSQGASEGGWGSPCTRLRASSRSASVLTLVLD